MYDPREEGMAPSDPAKKGRTGLILFVLSILIISITPVGIMVLVGGGSRGIVVPTLIGLIIVGVISLRVKSEVVFKIIFLSLLVLAILNVSGCMKMWGGLSNIH